jgi:glycosyltransferase involved in cell wall biosynthesis
MQPKLSLIFGFKNKEVERVKRCLDSLVPQTNKDFEVIFVDYGSDFNISTQIEALVSKYPFCKYVFNNTRGMLWNRSHALNTGIKLAEGEYVMTTDIDLIYNPDFIRKVIDQAHPEIELHSNAYALPEKFSKWKSLFTSPPKMKERDLTAFGLAQCVKLKHLKEIGGFDEFYCVYGREDTDLNMRLEQKGLRTEWMDLASNKVYHQWHPHSIKSSNKVMPAGWINMIHQYYIKYEKTITRNHGSWGEIYDNNRTTLLLKQNADDITKMCKIEAISIQSALLDILSHLDALDTGESLMVSYQDNYSIELQESKVWRFTEWFNRFSYKKRLPVKLVIDSFHKKSHLTTYDLRDIVLYLKADFKIQQDYYLEMSENSLDAILIKI